MRENLTELVFILDKSGSMSGLESDTIGGFNSMIQKQQKEEGEVVVSTVLFSDSSTVLHDRLSISQVKKMTADDYFVGGCTALLDAIGDTIERIATVQKYARKEDRPAKTLFVITTDGLENASKHYDQKDVKRMIEQYKEKNNWEFLFLGANIDAVQVAGNLGINSSRAANYQCDEEGTALNFKVLEAAVSRARKCKPSDFAEMLDDGEWKEEIDRDFKARKK